jgi:hypothetical protein
MSYEARTPNQHKYGALEYRYIKALALNINILYNKKNVLKIIFKYSSVDESSIRCSITN